MFVVVFLLLGRQLSRFIHWYIYQTLLKRKLPEPTIQDFDLVVDMGVDAKACIDAFSFTNHTDIMVLLALIISKDKSLRSISFYDVIVLLCLSAGEAGKRVCG